MCPREANYPHCFEHNEDALTKRRVTFAPCSSHTHSCPDSGYPSSQPPISSSVDGTVPSGTQKTGRRLRRSNSTPSAGPDYLLPLMFFLVCPAVIILFSFLLIPSTWSKL
ncbi:unnamed protein product [Protopolystoma xenopodis]|uniref:Uncharacterized protein n=1 Tax=Protopolystoma xenopodis TaxID=117903 RepID=A0A3S5A6S1_9PLAT|nr:unnamed protein product [Protopolystoma xenopodis]